ncbi:MAG TPA: polyhydroxyalkanoate synthesis regulator DNA-binding domain-containing protein [Candidatus Dormibacteraeota bacterium]|nr:polyhydroxyalkanoate synthesis regulator DNA-binding domain-containing protein [Candidatus Dormibacteraeota bacterium]
MTQEIGALETHVIKKYSNRKLYDTYTRRYVTLDVIADLLRDGHEVRVVDRNTGEDITAVTLSQILLDMERHRRGPLPEPILVDLVKERGEQLLGLVRASLSLPKSLPKTVRQRAAGSLDRTAERLEERVDDVLTLGLHNLNIATVEDMQRLERKVEDLAERVEELLRQANGRRSPGGRRA